MNQKNKLLVLLLFIALIFALAILTSMEEVKGIIFYIGGGK